MSRSQIDYLRHILDEAGYIENVLGNVSQADFLADETLKRAIARSIEIIGEAAKNLSEDFRGAHSGISWADMMRMRDKLIHHYFGIDYEIVWDTAKTEIPALRKQIEKILKQMDKK